MCALYGWPLNGQCGGVVNYYWTSESDATNPGFRWNVGMDSGSSLSSINFNQYYVACVR
ncbi:TPA: hypothetical protein P2Q91_002727 [Aeromonas veronii]|nr:hypothetical protein [Aeromonas veronii]HDO1338259.1 hypothetical protein [Aeromonas veronii]HDO1342044.1 hypothetical protein [Aeromonas veronii]HDO1348156.1 hypothetical protein [Aeromonas veronii]HDO1352316.1 hypothetical protein [Aeromonas veronii]